MGNQARTADGICWPHLVGALALSKTPLFVTRVFLYFWELTEGKRFRNGTRTARARERPDLDR